MSFLNAQSATLAVSLHCVFAQKYRVSITVNCIIRKIRNIYTYYPYWIAILQNIQTPWSNPKSLTAKYSDVDEIFIAVIIIYIVYPYYH